MFAFIERKENDTPRKALKQYQTIAAEILA